MVTDRVASVAVAVLERASAERPADAVLREVLRDQRLVPADSRQVARAVFAWYRWRGWLDASLPRPEAVRRALERQEQFEHDRSSVSEEDLRRHAVPAW